MKTKFMLVAVMAVASAVFAGNPNPKVAVINQKQTGTFKVIYEGVKAGKVKLNILDSKGAVVYAETMNNVSGFIRPVNFRGLAFGEYTIQIVDGTSTEATKVTYANESVAQNVHVAKTKEEGKYLVAASNFANETINVSIYDGDDKLVHTENVTVNGTIGLVFNLKEIQGTPTFEVSDASGAVKKIKY